MKSPLMEYNCGGGAWRLKWNPVDPNYLLVAAMFNGGQILNIPLDSDNSTEPKNTNSPSLLAKFEGHESMTYGIDWNYYNNSIAKKSKYLVTSCSFYDKSCHFWRYDTKA
ncbi:Diphthine methyltransferase-like protein [Smittium culicis]|uniref:Diphthine methyltransferase-like protein n=1 Tax=Smittium culicis TaxID=133412 RepID=A0A1R1XXL5_9FUNG|nr:Diphthine methyltransferase-like protein [Smittium culicis]